LFESNAIASYVSNQALRGGSVEINQALVKQYIDFAENEILPAACAWTYPTLGFKQYNKQETENAQKHIQKCLTLLNDLLLTRTFLVGERVTLADITLCCNLLTLYVQVLDPKFREPYGNVNRWFLTCVNQPNFKKVLGEVPLCTKMAVFDNAKYQEIHGKAQKKGKEPKKEQPKKKEQPPKEPAATDAPEEAPKPKKIDYFADVPKSLCLNMIMANSFWILGRKCIQTTKQKYPTLGCGKTLMITPTAFGSVNSSIEKNMQQSFLR